MQKQLTVIAVTRKLHARLKRRAKMEGRPVQEVAMSLLDSGDYRHADAVGVRAALASVEAQLRKVRATIRGRALVAELHSNGKRG